LRCPCPAIADNVNSGKAVECRTGLHSNYLRRDRFRLHCVSEQAELAPTRNGRVIHKDDPGFSIHSFIYPTLGNHPLSGSFRRMSLLGSATRTPVEFPVRLAREPKREATDHSSVAL
jgi:hypothetical protein